MYRGHFQRIKTDRIRHKICLIQGFFKMKILNQRYILLKKSTKIIQVK